MLKLSFNFTAKSPTLFHAHIQNKTKGTEAEVVADYDGAASHCTRITHEGERRGGGLHSSHGVEADTVLPYFSEVSAHSRLLPNHP